MNVILDAADSVRDAVARAELLATPIEERVERFNEATGVYGYMTAVGPLGGNYHPDRCRCQGNPYTEEELSVDLRVGCVGGSGDSTPHKHYERPPYSCARCSCSAYVPHDWPENEPLPNRRDKTGTHG